MSTLTDSYTKVKRGRGGRRRGAGHVTDGSRPPSGAPPRGGVGPRRPGAEAVVDHPERGARVGAVGLRARGRRGPDRPGRRRRVAPRAVAGGTARLPGVATG